MVDYDVGIIGAGVAGAFAALKIAKEFKDVKTIVFDLGRPPMKRRRQLEGWLGCLPNSDGKLYLNDLIEVAKIVGNKKAKDSFAYVQKILSKINDFSILKDQGPITSIQTQLLKFKYNLILNDYIQTYPKDIHSLSKHLATVIESAKNVSFSFDNEVTDVSNSNGFFNLVTENFECRCKKIIIATGRSGWRWSRYLFNHFNIITDNNQAHFGTRIEMNASFLKDFNKSNCTLTKNDFVAGPLNWHGTIIPEDHIDIAISSFRSNENRWKSDKVSFALIGKRNFENYGFEQTDRLGKLTFLISNDRIVKERVSLLLTNKSKISIIKEYDWLKDSILDLSSIIPEIVNKAYFHVPTILTMPPKINIKNNLESDVPGMFVVGENARVHGILAAACMGSLVPEFVCN